MAWSEWETVGIDYETIYEFGVLNPYNFVGENPYNVPMNVGIRNNTFYNTLPIDMVDVIAVRAQITFYGYTGLGQICYYTVGTVANPGGVITTGFRDIGIQLRYIPVYNPVNDKYIGLMFSGGSAIVNNAWVSPSYKVNKIELIKG